MSEPQLPEPDGFSAGTADAALFSLKRRTAENFAKGGGTQVCEWYSASTVLAVAAERDKYKAFADHLARQLVEAGLIVDLSRVVPGVNVKVTPEFTQSSHTDPAGPPKPA